jgi:hypothetical protein
MEVPSKYRRVRAQISVIDLNLNQSTVNPQLTSNSFWSITLAI